MPMADLLTIGCPFIEERGEYTRLAASIERAGNSNTLYFDVDKRYGCYLDDERVDAFVLALLGYAMLESCDIKCEAPLSERLHYQLSVQYIPVMHSIAPDTMFEVRLDAPIVPDRALHAKGVITGVSRGVDSLYTILKHIGCEQPAHRLTHLLIAEVNSYAGTGEERDQAFARECADAQVVADAANLELVRMRNNRTSDFPCRFNYGMHSMQWASFAYALSGLVRVYYLSSGVAFQESGFDVLGDTAHYDMFNLPQFSSDAITLYSAGAETLRFDKTAALAENALAQRLLHVCNSAVGQVNCSTCEKCLRTMADLDCLGKLDAFSKVFDLDIWRHKRTSYLARMIYRNDCFDAETLRRMRMRGQGIPFRSKVIGYVMRPAWHLVHGLWSNLRFRKLCYRFNLDCLVFGKKDAFARRRTYFGQV